MADSTENYIPAGAPTPVEIPIPATLAGERLDVALARLVAGYSRTRLARWVAQGLVTVDGAPAVPSRRLLGGERVVLVPAPEVETGPSGPERIPLSIVHEDEALLVVDKPAGLVVHPGAGNRTGTLLNALLAHAPGLQTIPRAGIVHRLDKDTSGLMVVAKSLAAQAALASQLAARTMSRQYVAAVHGRVSRGGSIDAPLGRHPRSRTRMAVVAGGRHAVTHYEIIERFPAATLLRCRLETGRTHQIRVHLQSAGHPLIGDPTYGGARRTPAFHRQALHAERLALVHPATGAPASWTSALPADMVALIAQLRTAGAPSRQRAARTLRKRK